MTERPKRQVVDVSGGSLFIDLEDGRVRVRFPLFDVEAEGADRDEAFEQLVPLLREHLSSNEAAQQAFSEWAQEHIIEVEMTDEEIAESRELENLVERGKKIGKEFRALDAPSFVSFVASATPVVVDFWAEWCQPCHMLAPVLKEVTDELSLPVGKVNIDEYPDIWEEIPSNGIPTLAVYTNGRRRGIVVGAGRSPDELKAELQMFLS